MAQYEFALDPSDTIVDIRDLNEARRRDAFTCPDCRSRLTPILKDDFRQKHFRHEPGVACSGETDIHWRLKHAFADAFRSARSTGLPFGAEIEQRHACMNGCCLKDSEWVAYDLTVFDDVRVELPLSHDGVRFIPDCYLTDSTGVHDPLFFEVRVTSENSEAKINSGCPILEMIVRPKDAHDWKEREEREQRCLGAIRDRLIPHDLTLWHSFEMPIRKDRTCQARTRGSSGPILAPPAKRRSPEYTFTGMTMTPPDEYRGEGADGRLLLTLTWFPWNGARILWDVDARKYLVIQHGVDHGVFPNHGQAYEFCQARTAEDQRPQEKVDERKPIGAQATG